MATKAEKIIAATLSWDAADVADYRYQSTRTSRAIYFVGDTMFATGQRPPKDYDGWTRHKDQFWAERNNTVLWTRKQEDV